MLGWPFWMVIFCSLRPVGLANLDDLEVVVTSRVIDLADGEVKQGLFR